MRQVARPDKMRQDDNTVMTVKRFFKMYLLFYDYHSLTMITLRQNHKYFLCPHSKKGGAF